MTRTRILFVSEAVTLAQIVRLVTLARALDPHAYDVHFASAHFPDFVFDDTSFTRWNLFSRPADDVERDVRRGRRLYDLRTLQRYVRADEEVIAQARPHLIIGDLRWSLAVSAPIHRVPFATLINAYWSPYACPGHVLPLPDHPLVNWLGDTRAASGYAMAAPYVFRFFAEPLNALRRQHNLPTLGSLREVLACGDWVLYPDVPELTPVHGAPANHRWLGPVPWSPKVAVPWHRPVRDSRRRQVYVTLGSSGRVDIVEAVVNGLVSADVDVLLSTAGREVRVASSPRLRVFDFLPGDIAAATSDLVVCNGGSTTGYQALAAGCPVLALPSNLDQCLATQAMVAFGAARAIPARRVTESAVLEAARTMLAETAYRDHARRAAQAMARWNATQRFGDFVAAATPAAQC